VEEDGSGMRRMFDIPFTHPQKNLGEHDERA